MLCGRLRCGKTDLTHLSLYFHRRQWKGTATEVQIGDTMGRVLAQHASDLEFYPQH